MTAIILAGGKSSRMGRNKAFLKFKDKTFLECQIELLKEIFDEIIISANSPKEYEIFNIPVIEDAYYDKGPLGGIYTGLVNSKSFYTFFLACDMPFIEKPLIKSLQNFTNGYDVIVPQNSNQLEPLHAFYSKNCITPIKNQIDTNNLKIIDFYPQVKVKRVEIDEYINPKKENETSLTNLTPLTNLNTMEEYILHTGNYSV